MSPTQDQPNTVEIYGARDWEHAKEFMTAMMEKSRLSSNPTPQPEPIQLNLDEQVSIWKLVTKYYEALLEITYSCNLTPRHFSHSNNNRTCLATVILWESLDDKDHLESVLQCFSESCSDSKLVVVQVDPQLLEDDNDWHQICFDHGFECHSAFDLGEASMSWQCCPWPSIQIIKGQTNLANPLAAELDPTPPSTHTEAQYSDDDDDSGEVRSMSTGEGARGEDETGGGGQEEGFEDDFSPFVSAESDLTEWDYKNLSDGEGEGENDEDSIHSTDVNNMARQLFGQNSDYSDDQFGDLQNLVAQIHQLKLDAANLDRPSRHRFAAHVALAVQSRLAS